MNHRLQPALRLTLLLATSLLLTSCAAYNGTGLQPGQASIQDTVKLMGQPAMRWKNPDQTEQLAFPRGPFGLHTYMAYFSAGGTLQKLENVLDPQIFARIKPGMTQAEVLRLLGPSDPHATAYFKARDELVWEWRYCDDWKQSARFDVLFDNSKGTVRSTQSIEENLLGYCSYGGCICSR